MVAKLAGKIGLKKIAILGKFEAFGDQSFKNYISAQANTKKTTF